MTDPALNALLQQARDQMHAGRLDQAESVCRAVLARDAQLPEPHRLLGLIAHMHGDNDEAVRLLHQAIERGPREALYYDNLSYVLKAAGQPEAAVGAALHALMLQPSFPEAENNLANALLALQRWPEAESACRRALAMQPNLGEAWHNLGHALQGQGRLSEADEAYRRTLELMPRYAECYHSLASLAEARGLPREAEAMYLQAVTLYPQMVAAWRDYAVMLQNLGRLAEAEQATLRAIEADESSPDLHLMLAYQRFFQERHADALKSAQRCRELDPEAVGAWELEGLLLGLLGRSTEAVAAVRRAIELDPGRALTYGRLGMIFQQYGRLEDARQSYLKALEIQPDFAAAHSASIYCLQYGETVTPSALAKAHAEWEKCHAAPLRPQWLPCANTREPERRLRLGFCSPDFGRHPVGLLAIKVLEAIDREQFDVVCFSQRVAEDPITRRFARASTALHRTAGDDPGALAKFIHEEKIDVLFDMAGHTADNRLITFALKPAPIQITWLGYVGTTGLAAMDYILADRHTIPPGFEEHYTEQVLRLPEGYVCFEPPADAPPVGPLPASARGHVTFGCFNNPCKLNAGLAAVWADVLRQVPDSRLVLKYRGLTDATTQRRIRDWFVDEKIDVGRIEFLGWSPDAARFHDYLRIDLALDPFPYTGGFTTCESLWMGVPVVTCPGATFASRQSYSHLMASGIPECIARDAEDYVRVAVRLARDLPALARLRGELRTRIAGSPLCDAQQTARGLERLVRDAWRRWCGGHEAHAG